MKSAPELTLIASTWRNTSQQAYSTKIRLSFASFTVLGFIQCSESQLWQLHKTPMARRLELLKNRNGQKNPQQLAFQSIDLTLIHLKYYSKFWRGVHIFRLWNFRIMVWRIVLSLNWLGTFRLITVLSSTYLLIGIHYTKMILKQGTAMQQVAPINFGKLNQKTFLIPGQSSLNLTRNFKWCSWDLMSYKITILEQFVRFWRQILPSRFLTLVVIGI